MTTIARGSRLVLRTGSGPVPLRTLAEVRLVGRWAVPVLAPHRALGDGDGVLEAATPAGALSLAAHLRLRDGVLELCPGSTDAPALRQRRQDVRGRLSLPLRATAADAAAQRVFSDGVVEGVTLDVSAGGVGVDLHPRSGSTPYGSRLYLELSDRKLHGRFVDIAAADREHLVRLVFVEQRRALAERRRSGH